MIDLRPFAQPGDDNHGRLGAEGPASSENGSADRRRNRPRLERLGRRRSAAGHPLLMIARRRIPMAHKFEIYKDKAGEFRVRFKYNNEVIFATEGYKSKSSAQNSIESIKKNGPGAVVEDNSSGDD